MDQKIVVAQIVKPQGIKGEIKARLLLTDGFQLENLNNLYINDTKVTMESFRVDKEFVYVKFLEINSRNEAEALRNKNITTLKEELESFLGDGEYFIEDLIGMACIFEDGEILGDVADIQNFGSKDVYYVNKTNGKEILFSAVDGVIIEVDKEKNTIILNKKKFNEVCV